MTIRKTPTYCVITQTLECHQSFFTITIITTITHSHSNNNINIELHFLHPSACWAHYNHHPSFYDPSNFRPSHIQKLIQRIWGQYGWCVCVCCKYCHCHCCPKHARFCIFQTRREMKIKIYVNEYLLQFGWWVREWVNVRCFFFLFFFLSVV